MMPGAGPKPRNTKLKLLIVDDELAIRTMLIQIFNRSGHSVRACADGCSALSGIQNRIPDILLSDLNMPGMSGFELLAAVHRQFPGVKTIAMSGAYCGADLPIGVEADAFYNKATGLDSLIKIVDRVAARGVWFQPPGAELERRKTRQISSKIHLV